MRRLVLAMLLGSVGVSHARVTASSQFCVNVAIELSLQPPSWLVSIVPSGLSSDLPVGVSSWTCIANDADGAIATFDLTVTFVTGDAATLVPGVYCITIVGTVTAK